MSVKSPNPIDTFVGARVRLQRQVLGMSQSTLAGALNITFQQVQKYEKGTNRIGASRLQEIARVLGVPVSFFFRDGDDLPASTIGIELRNAESNTVMQYLANADGLKLNQAFVRIKDPTVRQSIITFIESLSRTELMITADPAGQSRILSLHGTRIS
ncbi:MAG: transcriptional regulator protein [Rhizobium sp.]|nr:transcriptional regulator protein [Rhizobium sp.]